MSRVYSVERGPITKELGLACVSLAWRGLEEALDQGHMPPCSSLLRCPLDTGPPDPRAHPGALTLGPPRCLEPRPSTPPLSRDSLVRPLGRSLTALCPPATLMWSSLVPASFPWPSARVSASWAHLQCVGCPVAHSLKSGSCLDEEPRFYPTLPLGNLYVDFSEPLSWQLLQVLSHPTQLYLQGQLQSGS